ncbi:MAG: RluA family pseudouridine synthase [Firmicutes bacterium]|nr:RluA family pseudouridine synthase [Bacillota bacterium]
MRILHEDNHIIVVEKPQNVPSQEDSSKDLDLLSMVKAYLKEKYNKPGNVYTGLVHRLDRPTGGVMVFAKTSKAAARLSEQLKIGEVQKRYFAIVSGYLHDRVAHLSDWLVKDEKNNVVKRVVAKEEGAKKAEMTYNVLASDEGLILVDINLLTGRSHQARVQMASAGAPIFGDSKYGSPHSGNLALWAYQLSFTHPITGATMLFKCYPPDTLFPWSNFEFEKFMQIAKPR